MLIMPAAAKFWGLTVLLVLVTITTVACGSKAIPTPLPTPTLSPTEVRQVLANVALGFSDLPSGYTSGGPGTYSSNEEVAKDSILGQAVYLPKLEEYGRVMGYSVSYTKGTRVLINSVDLHRDRAGATAMAQWLPPGYQSQTQYTADDFAHGLASQLRVNPSQLRVGVEQISFPSFGDWSQALRSSISTPTLPVPLNFYIACEVKGRFSACALILDVSTEQGILQELEMAARSMDVKMASSQ